MRKFLVGCCGWQVCSEHIIFLTKEVSSKKRSKQNPFFLVLSSTCICSWVVLVNRGHGLSQSQWTRPIVAQDDPPCTWLHLLDQGTTAFEKVMIATKTSPINNFLVLCDIFSGQPLQWYSEVFLHRFEVSYHAKVVACI